jgi:hypothetical protein
MDAGAWKGVTCKESKMKKKSEEEKEYPGTVPISIPLLPFPTLHHKNNLVSLDKLHD